MVNRTIRTDPLRSIRHRSATPVTQYCTLLKIIDDFDEEMIFHDYDNNWETCAYAPVWCIVEILYIRLRSDMPNQRLIDESFTVCVMERASRSRPDGIYERMRTAWAKID